MNEKHKILLFVVGVCFISIWLFMDNVEQWKLDLSAMNSLDYRQTCKPFKLDSVFQCSKLFRNDSENDSHSSTNWIPNKTYSDEFMVNMTSDCALLREKFCFPTLPLSAEEAKFPLAFSIIVYNDMEQFLRMFQSVYWPQNLYCITYDTKSNSAVHGTRQPVLAFARTSVQLAYLSIQLAYISVQLA